jgi:hypothetical protein
MAEISDILTKIERTNQDKVSWQTTADDRAFIAVLGNASVMVLQDSSEYLILKILNAEGREIEQLDTGVGVGTDWRGELEDLYTKARRIALGVDSQLDSLLQELESDV